MRWNGGEVAECAMHFGRHIAGTERGTGTATCTSSEAETQEEPQEAGLAHGLYIPWDNPKSTSLAA